MKLATLEKNLQAWKGDAALLFLVRSLLIEKYPDLPIKLLYARQESLVSNAGLNKYCKRNRLEYGCNIMELELGKMLLNNPEQAKAIVEDIWRHDKVCKRLDAIQLKDGKICPEFLANFIEKERIRSKKQKIFSVIRKIPLHWRTKDSLCRVANKIINKLFNYQPRKNGNEHHTYLSKSKTS